ncbi:MAG: hypothetical protein KA319_11130 [Ferruginibacter sp.]|nr:hypothetical protein [Ferruginibacter sp.]
MIKWIAILICTFININAAFSQSILGDWQGNFVNNQKNDNSKPYLAKLIFKNNAEGNLEGQSISYFKIADNKIDSVVCKLDFLEKHGDRYFFREAEILNTNTSLLNSHCFQIVHFIIGKRKKEDYLHCRFTEDIEGEEEGKCTYGFLNLYKYKN